MAKQEDHSCDLFPLLDEFLATGDSEKLTSHIVSNSNLPGRRANLELAAAFADVVADCADQEHERLWALCRNMTAISADEAPVKNPGHRPGLLPRKKPLGPAAPKPPLAIPPRPQVGASWLFPVNAPQEFIPFCGAVGIGAVGSSVVEYATKALTTLRALANDPRWRMREAVCFGLQRLLTKRGQVTREALAGWVA
jgi:hypothetical protein